MSSCVQIPCMLRGQLLAHCSPSSSLRVLPFPLLQCPLSFGGVWGCWCKYPIHGGKVTVTQFQHFEQPCVSKLINHYPPQWVASLVKSEAAPIYEYKHKYLDVSLTIWILTRKIWLGLLLDPVTSLAIGSDHAHSTNQWFPPREQISNPIKRVFVYLHRQSCHY